MAQSLWNRFNGTRMEVLEYAWNFGVFQAMGKYDIRCVDAMYKFLVKASGDPDIVGKCIANSIEGKDWEARIVDELIRRCVASEISGERKDKRISILEEKIRLVDQDNQMKAMALLRNLRGQPLLERV